MPEPTAHKSDGVRSVMSSLSAHLTGRTLDENLRQNLCPACGKPVGEFKDALSRKEYGISGMCQTCQDAVFEES